MIQPRIILVGTVHLDPHGHARLLAFLHKHQPNLVTVEISQYALEYRKSHAAELLSRLNPFRDQQGNLPNPMCAVEAQIRVPFEYAATETYCAESAAKVFPVGDGTLSRQLLDRLEKELMVTDNLVKLAIRQEPTLANQVEKEWVFAQQNLHRDPTMGTRASARFERLNRRMSRKIQEYAQEGLLIHVGGWEHLNGLNKQLSALDPQVCLLNPT